MLSVEERLWSKTRLLDDGCLVWTGGTVAGGRFGQMQLQGKQLLAHRVSICLAKGLDPFRLDPEVKVLPSCGKTLCIEPSHLYFGTQRDLDCARKPLPLEERFWANTERRDDGCLIWTGTGQYGYGQIGDGGRMFLAHRVAICLARGLDPTTLDPEVKVLRSCREKRCVEPSHLYFGTSAEAAVQHLVEGLVHPRAKLSKEQVLAIRRRLADGASLSQVAKEYGLSTGHVSNIKTRRLWSHI